MQASAMGDFVTMLIVWRRRSRIGLLVLVCDNL